MMLKSWAVLAVAVSVLVSSGAWALEFTCRADVAGQVGDFSVIKKDGKYLATYTSTQGNLVTEPAKFRRLSRTQIGNDQTLNWMARILKLDLHQVDAAKTFTIGNIEDDLAGIMGVALYDRAGQPLSRVILWGWAGPLFCL